MRFGNRAKFFRCFRKRDVEPRFASAGPLKKKLKRERCFTSARRSFDEVNPVFGESPAKNIIKPAYAGGNARWVIGRTSHCSPLFGSIGNAAALPGFPKSFVTVRVRNIFSGRTGCLRAVSPADST